MTREGVEREGRIFVVSGPSGAGKSTVIDKVLEEGQDHIRRAITCTTRPLRRGEKRGVDYIYLTSEEFAEKQERGDFLESASVFGHSYGTLTQTVLDMRKQGYDVVLVIDVQGALEVIKKMKVTSIFIKPPSRAELERRIRCRATENPEEIKIRLDQAEQEMAASHNYDYIVVNDDLKEACKVIKEIMNRGEVDHV